jgi:hypothetical protein
VVVEIENVVYTGAPSNLNISPIRFLAITHTNGAITWYRLRLYMHCAAHKVTAHNNEWLLRIEMLFILGLYVTSNISLIRFLSYYTSGLVGRLRLYMHYTAHKVTAHGCEWLLRNRKCCLYWGSYVTSTSPWFNFFYYTSCGAITCTGLRLYSIVQHTSCSS